jgi:hypothetical protein
VATPEEIAATSRIIREASEVPSLIRLRARTGQKLGVALVKAGRFLHVRGHLIGPGRIDGTSTRGNGDDELVAVGALLQVGGELAWSAVELISIRRHYAGAALVRQLVEVEYLMWAFAESPSDARAWLNSTPEQRQTLFRPKELRKRSKGRFKGKDYGHHCEMGGHPVPRSLSLIGGADNAVVQLLLVDILLHGWRTADSAIAWAMKKDAKHVSPAVGSTLQPARAKLAAWGKRDPLYHSVGESPS